MPYLKWVEPWGGYKIPNDTGFCNRIFHWEFAYEVSKRNNFDFKILLQEQFWPEYKYIDLPYIIIIYTNRQTLIFHYFSLIIYLTIQ